jgi:hypothetical protein
MFSGLFGATEQEWKYDDLPSPDNDDQYINLSEICIEKRKQMIDSKGWSLVKTRKNLKHGGEIVIESKPVEGSDIMIVRVTGYIRLAEGMNLDNLAQQLYDPTFEERKRLNENVTGYEKLKSIVDSVFVNRTVASALGITDREFVALKTYERTGMGYVIATQSINSKEYPFDPNCVRGVSSCGMELTMVSDTVVKIVSVDHIDPKGWVPGMIINSFIETSGDWLETL